MSSQKMTSSRPYLLRAIYDWIVDNGLTPYLLVDATANHVIVPQQYVNNGKIILNISPVAVQHFAITDDEVTFNARFDGQPLAVSSPITATLAIYAKENGRGMVFTEDDTPSGPDSGSEKANEKAKTEHKARPEPIRKSKTPNLRVVK